MARRVDRGLFLWDSAASGWLLGWTACGVAALLVGCTAVYPELQSPVRPVEAAEVQPEPPDDVLYVRVKRAEIPAQTRDGRKWDEVGGQAPDPFVILYANDEELFRTPIQSNTLRPTWTTAERANFRIPVGSAVRVELYDRNQVQDRPIGTSSFSDLHSDKESGEREIKCASGAKIWLTVEPAHAKLGLGLVYQVRPKEVVLTRVVEESPAGRADLRPGDRIVGIQGKLVRLMAEDEARSQINAHARTGLQLTVSDGTGASRLVTLKEGAMYPLAHEGIPID